MTLLEDAIKKGLEQREENLRLEKEERIKRREEYDKEQRAKLQTCVDWLVSKGRDIIFTKIKDTIAYGDTAIYLDQKFRNTNGLPSLYNLSSAIDQDPEFEGIVTYPYTHKVSYSDARSDLEEGLMLSWHFKSLIIRNRK